MLLMKIIGIKSGSLSEIHARCEWMRMNERICASFSMSQLFFIAVNYLHNYYSGRGHGRGAVMDTRSGRGSSREIAAEICN